MASPCPQTVKRHVWEPIVAATPAVAAQQHCGLTACLLRGCARSAPGTARRAAIEIRPFPQRPPRGAALWLRGVHLLISGGIPFPMPAQTLQSLYFPARPECFQIRLLFYNNSLSGPRPFRCPTPNLWHVIRIRHRRCLPRAGPFLRAVVSPSRSSAPGRRQTPVSSRWRQGVCQLKGE